MIIINIKPINIYYYHYYYYILFILMFKLIVEFFHITQKQNYSKIYEGE